MNWIMAKWKKGSQGDILLEHTRYMRMSMVISRKEYTQHRRETGNLLAGTKMEAYSAAVRNLLTKI